MASTSGGSKLDPGALAIMVLLMLLVMCLVTVLALASSLEVVGGSFCRQTAGVFKLIETCESVMFVIKSISKFVFGKSRYYKFRMT